MADYFVANGGSNTSPYDTWAKAATSLATALAAATTSGDRVIIQHDGVPDTDAALAADTTYTANADIQVISATPDGASGFTPTQMGGENANCFIGHSSLNRGIILAGGFLVYLYGVALRTSGTVADSIQINTLDNGDFRLNKCRLWSRNTATGSRIRFGAGLQRNWYTELTDCEFWFGNASQRILIETPVVLRNCSLHSSSTTPTALLGTSSDRGVNINPLLLEGCNLSLLTTAVMQDQTNERLSATLVNCVLGAGCVPLLSQTASGNTAGEVWLFNTAIGNEHYHLGHYSGQGSTQISTTIYANDGASYDGTNRHSWRIDTTGQVSLTHPYQSPWIDRYFAPASTPAAIEPYLEICRSGSSTAFTNAQVWSDWSFQATSGSPLAVFKDDGCALTATPANQTASTLDGDDWTGEDSTSWFGKLESPSITPVNIGHVRGRVCVGLANTTLYVDPQIRGIS